MSRPRMLLSTSVRRTVARTTAAPCRFVNVSTYHPIPLYLRDSLRSASGSPFDLSRCLFRQRPDSDFRRCGSMDSLAPFLYRILF
jgi:hypothetical protein